MLNQAYIDTSMEEKGMITNTLLPMSLRTERTELNYKIAKENNALNPLNKVYPLENYMHWKIIKNDFPYDVCYKVSHILLIRREGVSSWHELNQDEISELNRLKRTVLYERYDQIVENSPSRRSVPNIFHLHLLKFYNKRNEMKL